MGQTDGRISLFQKPPGRGHNNGKDNRYRSNAQFAAVVRDNSRLWRPLANTLEIRPYRANYVKTVRHSQNRNE